MDVPSAIERSPMFTVIASSLEPPVATTIDAPVTRPLESSLRSRSGASCSATSEIRRTCAVTPGRSMNPAAGVSPWFPSVTLDVPIETAGKREYRIAQAQQLSESGRLSIASAAWQIRSTLRSSLLDYAAARQRAELLQKQVQAQQQIVTLLEQWPELQRRRMTQELAAITETVMGGLPKAIPYKNPFKFPPPGGEP